MDALSRLRGELDTLDARMLALLERRMDIAREIAAYKREKGLPVRDAAREAQVLRERIGRLENPANAKAAQELLETLMRLSRVEQETRIRGEEARA